MKHLEEKQQALAESPFVAFLMDPSYSPQDRLCFLPCLAPFAMGFTEIVNSLQGKASPVQEERPSRSSRWAPFLKSPLWAPFLNDLQLLDLHSISNFDSMMKVLSAEDCSPVRELLDDFVSLARSASPARRRILLMALQYVGQITVVAVEQIAREFTASTRRNLVSLSSLRSLLHMESWSTPSTAETLEPEMEEQAISDIDQVFDWAFELADYLLEYVVQHRLTGRAQRPPSLELANQIAAQTFLEFGTSRIEVLCKAAGFTASDTRKVQRYFTLMTASWNTRRIGDPSPWKSDISDDHTPFELSIALEGSRPEIRFLLESQNKPTTLQTSWNDGLALNERLHKDLGHSVDHFNRVKDLFEPRNPEARFSLWHAFCLKPAGQPEIKVYLNPCARGPENTNAILEEALDRLGFANAWRFLSQVVMRRGDRDQILYFSLDMGGQAVSRVKIYVAHQDASLDDLEAAMSQAKEYVAGEARAFCAAIQGEENRFSAPRSTLTCWAFTSNDDARPYSATLHCPIRYYADNDLDALSRIRTVINPKSLAVLHRCIWALANRPLTAGVGLSQWASMRREGGKVRTTFYLATEAYSTVARKNRPPSGARSPM